MSLSIRTAIPGDGAVLHAMVRELAHHHGYAAHFSAIPDDYEAVLRDPQPIVGALIAEWDGTPAGCAIWQRCYSTFIGREVIYLDDLSVLPLFRRRGIGAGLIRAVARLAVARGLTEVRWLMMEWNTDARRLYESLGAEVEDRNAYCSLSGAALERLGS